MAMRRRFVDSKKGYKIKELPSKTSGKFGGYDEYKIEITGLPVDVVLAFKNILKNSILKNKLIEGDKIRLIINHHKMSRPYSNKGYQTIPKLDKKEVENFILEHNGDFLEFMEYKDVPLNEVDISVHWAREPEKKGKGRKKVNQLNIWSKKSIITIFNEDTICMARSIVTAWAHKFRTRPSNKFNLEESEIKNFYRRNQELEAKELHKNSGVKIKEDGNNYEDAKIFADYLGIKINIIESNSLIGKPNFTYGEGESLYILKEGDHFHTITNIQGFWGEPYYCESCSKSYTRKDCHRCPDKCPCCFKNGKCNGDRFDCKECNRNFFTLSQTIPLEPLSLRCSL